MSERNRPPLSETSLRVVLKYENNEFALEYKRELEKISPKSHDIAPLENEVGSWIELRDEDNRVIYRRILDNLFGRSVETLSDSDNEVHARNNVSISKFLYPLLVPKYDNASFLVLFSDFKHEISKPIAAQEVARFNIRQSIKIQEIDKTNLKRD